MWEDAEQCPLHPLPAVTHLQRCIRSLLVRSLFGTKQGLQFADQHLSPISSQAASCPKILPMTLSIKNKSRCKDRSTQQPNIKGPFEMATKEVEPRPLHPMELVQVILSVSRPPRPQTQNPKGSNPPSPNTPTPNPKPTNRQRVEAEDPSGSEPQLKGLGSLGSRNQRRSAATWASG